MSEKNVKFLRGQVRQVVKQLLPEVFSTETSKAMEKVLVTRIDSRLSEITKVVKEALDTMDKRSLDMQSYVVRNVAVPAAPAAVTTDNS